MYGMKCTLVLEKSNLTISIPLYLRFSQTISAQPVKTTPIMVNELNIKKESTPTLVAIFKKDMYNSTRPIPTV